MNNIEKNHAAMVKGNTKSGENILNTMAPHDMHLFHMAVGISGEAGELLDAIKKSAVYNKPLDRENAIEELGDIEFYLQGIRAGLNVSRDEVLQANIDKLEKRYPKGYTDKAAQDRVDKVPADNSNEANQARSLSIEESHNIVRKTKKPYVSPWQNKPGRGLWF